MLSINDDSPRFPTPPRRILEAVSPIELTVAAALPPAILFTRLAGRRFDWLLIENLQLFAGMLSWFVPCLLARFVGHLFKWPRSVMRAVFLAYYLVVTLWLMGTGMLTALVRTQWLSSAITGEYPIGTIDLYLTLATLVMMLAAYRKDPAHTLDATAREVRELLIILRFLISLALMFSIYSNLKAVIPVIRPGLYDPVLYHMDKILFLGHDPFRLITSITSPAFALLMVRSYYCLFFFLLFGLSGAFVFRSVRFFEKVVLALILTYLLSTIGYYLVPSVGPAFHNETWQLFRATSGEPLKIGLYRLYRMMCRSPATAPLDVFQGLAAFPSVHVAVMSVFLYYLWKCEKILALILVIPSILLTVSTIYLGWHYVVDLPAGLLVAVFAILTTEYMAAHHQTRYNTRSVVSRTP